MDQVASKNQEVPGRHRECGTHLDSYEHHDLLPFHDCPENSRIKLDELRVPLDYMCFFREQNFVEKSDQRTRSCSTLFLKECIFLNNHSYSI